MAGGKGSKRQSRMIWLMELAVVFIGVYFFSARIILWGTVPSASMSPTLEAGDLVLASGFAYSQQEPQRRDIVIFISHEEGIRGETLIKRIVGIPGDDIMFIDGQIIMNGRLYEEEYLSTGMETDAAKDYIVPEGCYFVMGDNRNNSYDSRYWEEPYVRKNEIKGKMILHISFSKLINLFSGE